MTHDEVVARLKEDLNIPLFNGKIPDKEYTEEDYQALKRDLEKYFDDYVRNTEH